ncbi:hypothetical protein G6F43_008643 [Rhizopus delemar]|nr:hypothetical protein G6F43_008643 [Rhizopus delemar]
MIINYWKKLDADGSTQVTTKILCYADDTLVFLNNPQVIQRLRFHLDMLSLASNARINYHKVESIFMFDRDHSRYWVGSLAELEILSIYLPSNPQSNAPTDYTALNLITIYPWECHNCQYFTIFHVLVSIPSDSRDPTRHQQNQKSPAKCYGGLSITDPHVQQADIYFRRIQPLLLDTHLGRKTEVNKVLQIHIQNSYKAEHHQITLLFPEGRPYLPRHLHNTCPQLVKSLDRIPREFS